MALLIKIGKQRVVYSRKRATYMFGDGCEEMHHNEVLHVVFMKAKVKLTKKGRDETEEEK
tara:strand:- start:66 stop:245 length:180 start_codon:yes stop_codon:yes gene_type:complete